MIWINGGVYAMMPFKLGKSSKRAGAVAALAIMLSGGAADAQVIEIGDDGSSRVYAGPTRFIAAGEESGGGYATVPLVKADASPDPFVRAATIHRLDVGLLRAVAWTESRGRNNAVSSKGALGVMQLMPGTAAALGVDPHDAAANIAGGAAYLARQIDRFGSVPLALAAYNAGPGAVLRWGGIPPYRETQGYVASVLGRWQGISNPVVGRGTPPIVPRAASLPIPVPGNGLLIEVSSQ